MRSSVTLADACSHIVDCEHKTAPIDEAGDYFAVGTPAMRGNVINYSESRRINKGTFDAWTRRLSPKQGDLLFAREAPVGPIVRIPPQANVAPGQRTVLLRPDQAVVDAEYLYFLLSSPTEQALISAKAAGSTVAHLNVADVRAFLLPQLPSLPEQRAIAEVLGALDDKIAANASIATTADGLVRAKFDAVVARSAATIPLGELAVNIRDQVRPKSVGSEVTYVGLEHLPRRNMWLPEAGNAADVTSGKSTFSKGDTLFGKLRPYFHKVVLAPAPGICSTDILVVRAAEESMRGLVLAACASDEAIAACTAASEGTRMPRASWKDLSAVSVPWHEGQAREFSRSVSDLGDMVASRLSENATLSRTRDTLLPLLMSGKVRVKDAERVVEGVV